MAKKPRPELVPIAERLIRTREALGFVDHGGQARYCEEAGLARNRYNQWEKARIRPTEKGLSKLRKRFGITYEWIWDGDPKGLPFDLAVKLGLGVAPRRVAASCALSACATSGAVQLRNADGMTVQCGPYQLLRTIYAPAEYVVTSQLRDCVEEYERQGYERVGARPQASR